MTATTSPGITIAEALREAKRRTLAAQPARTPAPSAPTRIVRKPKQLPLERIDALLRVPLFGPRNATTRAFDLGTKAREELGIGRPPTVYTTYGRPAARGWREAEARFTKLGLTVIPTPSGRVTLASPGGRAPEGTVEAFALVADWIGAGRAGTPWPCEWCTAEASTLLAGGVPACEEHSA